jgi:CHAD domain-containing protein
VITPHELLDAHVNAFLANLPAARDAEVEAVHLARVATRRIRETLPLFVQSAPHEVDRIRGLVRKAARRLGRVRELDVMDDDLARREMRLPSALGAIGAARRALSDRRLRARRKLVKTLDRLALNQPEHFRLAAAGHWWSFRRSAREWDDALRQRILDRACRLGKAIDHATAVYFPNRLHDVRIAAKKLRYSIELAQQRGLLRPAGMLGDLRRVQESLGRLHDAHVLLRSADEFLAEEVDPRERRLLTDDLRGEIAERHAEYLAMRDKVMAVCDTCRRFGEAAVRHRLAARPLLAASAVAVPAGLLLISGRGR